MICSCKYLSMSVFNIVDHKQRFEILEEHQSHHNKKQQAMASPRLYVIKFP
jgi:hypothetical protein